MAEPFEGRVAVYIDFDNIVISRYDQVHGRGAWRKDNVYRLPSGLTGARTTLKTKLAARRRSTFSAYSSVFLRRALGRSCSHRAYADWSIRWLTLPTSVAAPMERAVRPHPALPRPPAVCKNCMPDIPPQSVDVRRRRLPVLSRQFTHASSRRADSTNYIALGAALQRLGRFYRRRHFGVCGRHEQEASYRRLLLTSSPTRTVLRCIGRASRHSPRDLLASAVEAEDATVLLGGGRPVRRGRRRE